MMLELRMVDYNYQLVNESIKISESWSIIGAMIWCNVNIRIYSRIETQETWKLGHDCDVWLDC